MLTDQELIEDMKKYYEGCTDEEKVEYREGLKVLCDRMRDEKWDVERCVSAIIDFRKEFNARHPLDCFNAPRQVIFNKKKPLDHPLECEEEEAPTSDDYISESLPTPNLEESSQDMYSPSSPEPTYGEDDMEEDNVVNYEDNINCVEPNIDDYACYEGDTDSNINEEDGESVQNQNEQPFDDFPIEEPQENRHLNHFDEFPIEEPQEEDRHPNHQQNGTSSGFGFFGAIYKFLSRG